MADTRSRKWLLTINNPSEKGFTHDRIKELVSGLASVSYWCMADEEGKTYHTHVFLCCKNQLRFSTLKNKFDGAHFDMARGSAQENRDYVSKTGKWENSKKQETSVEGTFEEYGEMPVERQGRRNDLDDLLSMIRSGMSDYDILEQDSSYMLNLDTIERTRQILKQEEYKSKWRELTVTYMYGDTGTGKTRGVMEQYGYENVFRVTDSLHPFDNYRGQDVIVFEEFHSNFKIRDMLNYLDGYPLELPCRYANKYACYTKVYIISNIPPSDQYEDLQRRDVETFRAFLRRIGSIIHYVNGGIKMEKVTGLFDFDVVDASEPIPFAR